MGVVQQGEAQNNDCLFVVFLLAVIIAPPPLKDAADTQRACQHTHAHTYAATGMCPHSCNKISICAFLKIEADCDTETLRKMIFQIMGYKRSELFVLFTPVGTKKLYLLIAPAISFCDEDLTAMNSPVFKLHQ